MDTDTQKLAAWCGGMFFGVWLILFVTWGTSSSLTWMRWLFMISTIMAGFFFGVATEPPIMNWTRWVALGSVAVTLQIFLAFSFDYILNLPGLIGAVAMITMAFSITMTSWIGGCFIGAYLTHE